MFQKSFKTKIFPLCKQYFLCLLTISYLSVYQLTHSPHRDSVENTRLAAAKFTCDIKINSHKRAATHSAVVKDTVGPKNKIMPVCHVA